jgi:hypothetical protein
VLTPKREIQNSSTRIYTSELVLYTIACTAAFSQSYSLSDTTISLLDMEVTFMDFTYVKAF